MDGATPGGREVPSPQAAGVVTALDPTSSAEPPPLPPTANRELASAVYRQVKDHPEQHDQKDFFSVDASGCATTACLAGWVVTLSRKGNLRQMTFPTELQWGPISWGAIAELGLKGDLNTVGEFMSRASEWLYKNVFYELGNRAALENFAGLFRLDPETGELLNLDEARAVTR